MSNTPTKIERVRVAGKKIETETRKPGFTVIDLMNALDWNTPEDKFYIQNVVAAMVRKGKAYKLSSTKPVVYSFQKPAKTPPQNASKNTKPQDPAVIQSKTVRPPATSLQDATPSDFEQLGVTPDMVGQAVFRIYRTLQRKIYNLEDELAQTKRKLDEANKRIREQTAIIERQNLAMSGKEKDGDELMPVKSRQNIIRVKRYG